MKAKKVSAKAKVSQYNSIQALKKKKYQDLCDKSIEALDNAYAPYSEFRVGAAILLDSGKIVTGSNQENAVYPLGLCAERVALFSAQNSYPSHVVKAIAVVTSSGSMNPAFPCGSCRQALLEHELKNKSSIKLLVVSKDKKVYKVESISELLPFAFSIDNLNSLT